MPETMPSCLVCGKELEEALPGLLTIEDAAQQPLDAVTFRGEGNYGSVIFDPMDGTYLEINVCDLCLSTYRDRVLHVKETVRRTRMAKPWEVDWIDDPALSAKEKRARFRALGPQQTKEPKK